MSKETQLRLIRRATLACMASWVIAAAGPVHADVLYDTTAMTDNLTYNTTRVSRIGALSSSNPNVLRDTNVADDFTLPDVFSITSITADFHNPTAPAGVFLGDGVLVEIFADSAGHPVEVPTTSFFATIGNGLAFQTFPTISGTTGLRFTMDLTGVGPALTSGTWWLSVVPTHDAIPSTDYRWVADSNSLTGGVIHVRDGGLDHGNGYQGNWGTQDWVPTPFGSATHADVAMRIEGVPEPSTLAILGCGAMAMLGRRARRGRA